MTRSGGGKPDVDASAASPGPIARSSRDAASETGPPPTCGKILLFISEDWFALSHFQPLIASLGEIGGDVVVATRSSGRTGEIAALGARVVEFDCRRSSLNPVEQVSTVRSMARLIRNESPDVVHVVAMQPMVLAALALPFAPPVRTMMHLTGLGFLGISEGRAARLIRPAAFRALRSRLDRADAWIIAENPEDHQYLIDQRAAPPGRATIVGGAGIDAQQYPLQPMKPEGEAISAAFVGRMIRSKGLDVLAEAARILERDGRGIGLDLYGKVDTDNPEAIDPEAVRSWQREGLLTWHGHVSDITAVWRDADIAILPAITREGMPRAVLEAAACGRPLIVTDVPGCRHFVRDGIEGIIVPPGDAQALATAMARLAGDRDLRCRMGQAARDRVLSGYTIGHVQAGIVAAYKALLRTA